MANNNYYGGQAQADIGAARDAGFFNPQGSGLIMRTTRREALRNSDNMRRRAAILARLQGLDPNQARVATLGADIAGSEGTANALNQAQYGQLESGQNFARGLYTGQLGQENAMRLAKYQHDLNKPTVGGQIGQIAGTVGGAFLGGPGGAALGNRIFGGGGGQPYTPIDYEQTPYHAYGPQP